MPDSDGRYLTVMVVNQDHYINRVFAQPVNTTLTVEEFDTPYVFLAARVLVDATDPDDIAKVHAIQDDFELSARADEPLSLPDYDEESFTAVRTAVLAEASKASTERTACSGRRKTSIPMRTCWAPPAGGVACPSRRPTTRAAHPNSPSPGTP